MADQGFLREVGALLESYSLENFSILKQFHNFKDRTFNGGSTYA